MAQPQAVYEQQPLAQAAPQTPGQNKRQPYQAPRLARFGSLATITRGNGGGGNMDDPVFDPVQSEGL